MCCAVRALPSNHLHTPTKHVLRSDVRWRAAASHIALCTAHSEQCLTLAQIASTHCSHSWCARTHSKNGTLLRVGKDNTHSHHTPHTQPTPALNMPHSQMRCCSQQRGSRRVWPVRNNTRSVLPKQCMLEASKPVRGVECVAAQKDVLRLSGVSGMSCPTSHATTSTRFCGRFGTQGSASRTWARRELAMPPAAAGSSTHTSAKSSSLRHRCNFVVISTSIIIQNTDFLAERVSKALCSVCGCGCAQG